MSENALIGQVLDLTNLIAYQEGAVVSRTLLDKPEGTLTVFSFEQGQGLSEHTSPYDATVQILDGQAVVVIDSKEHIAKTGELIIMPANKPHALKAVEKFKMLLIMIK